MSAPRFSSVEDYLTSLDPPKGETLRAVIDLVLGEFPDLEVKVSWNVPQIHRDGDYVFGVSAMKGHLALAPWSAEVIERFRERLENEGYTVKKNLFQIPVDWEVDHDLVGDLVRARLAEVNEEPSP